MLGGTQQLTDSTFTSSRHTPPGWPLRPPLDPSVFTPSHGPEGPASHGELLRCPGHTVPLEELTL